MRIAYSVVKHMLRGGGIEKYTLEVGKRLAARGHEVTVFSMGHYGHVDSWVEGMRIVKVPSSKRAAAEKLSAGASAALKVLLAREKFDIVHFHSIAAGVFGRLPASRGMQSVLQMHGIEWQRSRWSRLGREVLKTLEAVSLKSHHGYTAVSQTQCNFYQQHLGIPMRYIPTGADVKEREPANEILSMGLLPQRYVLFASRLVSEKGAHYLVRAFRKLNTDFKLVIAGDAKGEEFYKSELKEAAGGDARILFPGYVEGKKLEELFSHAAVYVQPSEIEGLSIALLEAMGYGNCCLVSDIPENKEAIATAGITFTNRDVDDLREKLEYLLSNPDIRSKLGVYARERVRMHYSWDRIAEDFELFYQSLLC